MVVPTEVNERWSSDSVHDQFTDGRCIPILDIVDDVYREYIG